MGFMTGRFILGDRRTSIRDELGRKAGRTARKNPRATFIIPGCIVDSVDDKGGGTLLWTPGETYGMMPSARRIWMQRLRP